MEAAGSDADANADGGVCKNLHQRIDDESRLARDGSLQRGHLLNLRPPGRDAQGDGSGCGAQEQPVQPPCHRPQPLRARSQQQDRHLRRSVGNGRCEDAAARRPARGMGKKEDEQRRRGGQALEFQSAALWRDDSERLSKMVPRWLLPSASSASTEAGRPFQDLAFLSLFGGVGKSGSILVAPVRFLT